MNNPAIDNATAFTPPQPEVDRDAIYQSVYNRFKNQVQAQFPKKLDKVTATIDFNDIGMDSLEKLSVAMDLEEEFGLFIPDEDIENCATIEAMAEYLITALLAKDSGQGCK